RRPVAAAAASTARQRSARPRRRASCFGVPSRDEPPAASTTAVNRSDAFRVAPRMRALYSTHERSNGAREARRSGGDLADVALSDRAGAAVVLDRKPRLALHPSSGLL